MSSWRGAYLVKHRDSFTFLLYRTKHTHMHHKQKSGFEGDHIVHNMKYVLKARTMKSVERAVLRERLCKCPLLGNRFVTYNNGVKGKRCFLRSPCDGYVAQYKNCWERWFICGPSRVYIMRRSCDYESHPCGGGFEYLHRDPASRRRRRKGKPQLWESKIWSRVPRDSDPRKWARAVSIYKRQTRPLVREVVPQKQGCN
jgi:hypothetical protein